MQKYVLNGSEYIQLCDLMKKIGMAESGGQAKSIISDGLVKVDGEIELRKRCKIKVGQVVEFADEKIKIEA